MNKKFLVVIICALTIIATKSQAQGIVFVAQDAQYSHPEVLVHIPPESQDNVIVQEAVFTEGAAQASASATNMADNAKNENISYYVQKLNLTPEQINKAQEISNTAHIKQEELLKNIENLRQQAHEIENSTLANFEAILTDEQKTEFYKLRNGQDITVSQPAPQPEEAQPAPQPEEAQPAPQPEEAQPAPQPEEAQPAPQPEEAQPAPQPEEAQPAPLPEEAQLAPLPEEAQPAPQPEEAQPAPQPEEAQPALQPEEAQPAPQPEEAQ